MKQIAQFTIPGQDGAPQQIEAPGGIPDQLKGGFDTSGQALVQLGLQWLFMIAATLTVIFIMYSGIQWMSSGGDPGKIAAARARLMYSVIGLVVVACAYFIVKLIVVTILGGDSAAFFDFSSLGK